MGVLDVQPPILLFNNPLPYIPSPGGSQGLPMGGVNRPTKGGRLSPTGGGPWSIPGEGFPLPPPLPWAFGRF